MSEETINNGEILPVEEGSHEERSAQKTSSAESLRILEALIFASDEYLTAARLRTILPGNPGAREISSMIEKVNRQLQKERHPFEIVEIGGGYQFKTVAYYHPWVRQIFQEKAAKRLSIQALECLSIIAYRQPLSKAEIEAIRGVISDGAMKTLLEKRLIMITGRSEKPGRPLLVRHHPRIPEVFRTQPNRGSSEYRGVRGDGAPEDRKSADRRARFHPGAGACTVGISHRRRSGGR